MTTIDKIRAEIERRIKSCDATSKTPNQLLWAELSALLPFLDTLEEPVGKTCKTCGFYENNCPFIRGKFISYPNKVCKDYTFSTLKAEQETVSEDLEEAADDHIRKVVDAAGHPGWDWETQDIADAFKAGAEWKKAKMMDGAVEGTVIELGETYKDLSLSVNAKELNQVLQPLGVGDGNKVKIIIVKEEEQ